MAKKAKAGRKAKTAKTAKSARSREAAGTKANKRDSAQLRKQAERTLSNSTSPVLEHAEGDLVQKRGLEGVPPAGRHKVIEITYVPPEDESQEVVIDGIKFRAYEPVAVPVDRQNMIQTLRQNKFFVAGKPDKKSPAYKVWALKHQQEGERTVLQQRHEKAMAKLRGGQGEDALPAQNQPNPPRGS